MPVRRRGPHVEDSAAKVATGSSGLAESVLSRPLPKVFLKTAISLPFLTFYFDQNWNTQYMSSQYKDSKSSVIRVLLLFGAVKLDRCWVLRSVQRDGIVSHVTLDHSYLVVKS